jgi:hypothetical protein
MLCARAGVRGVGAATLPMHEGIGTHLTEVLRVEGPRDAADEELLVVEAVRALHREAQRSAARNGALQQTQSQRVITGMHAGTMVSF